MTQKKYPVRSRLFHAICTDPDPAEQTTDYYQGAWWDEHLAGDKRFLSRLPADFSFTDKTVLDFGCGAGHTCVLAAERGAKRVLGVDLAGVNLARKQLAERYPELAGRVEFQQIKSIEDIGDQRFDLVFSKNTFEHVSDPDRYVADMASALAPGGQLVIGFSPLWKSPYGGHIQNMTKMPWAHLLFPEPVVLKERKRFRPEEDPQRYEDFKGGMNRMTLERFCSVMDRSGLEPTYFEINRNDHPVAKIASGLMRVPGLKEYFALSVHSMWRRRGDAARAA